jgi:hypothetical protein
MDQTLFAAERRELQNRALKKRPIPAEVEEIRRIREAAARTLSHEPIPAFTPNKKNQQKVADYNFPVMEVSGGDALSMFEKAARGNPHPPGNDQQRRPISFQK